MLPSVLASFVNLKQFQAARADGQFRDWVLDSGAYSALTSGATIDLHEFTDTAGRLLEEDPALKVVFALDVIGDPEASAKNAEYMWDQGVPAVPTFHYGEPWVYLPPLADNYDRIALGGLVQRGAGGHGAKVSWAARLKWLDQCFARVWPHWIHGFGCCDKRLLARLPFASVDSTTWYYGVARYGALRFGGNYHDARKFTRLVPPKSEAPEAAEAAVRINLKWHLEMEAGVRERFGRDLIKAGIEDPFSLRLGVSGGAEMAALGEVEI